MLFVYFRYADDDIALFKLQAPVIFNTYVIPVCLPDKEVFTTKRAIAIGYGKYMINLNFVNMNKLTYHER